MCVCVSVVIHVHLPSRNTIRYGMCGYVVYPTEYFIYHLSVCLSVCLSTTIAFYYSFLSFFPFVLLCPAYPSSHSQSPHCCSSPWVIHTCSLSSPFPVFPPVYPSLSPVTAVSLFHASMSLVLFCLFIYFVH